MQSQKRSTYEATRRTCWLYLGVLFGIAGMFGLLHIFFADLKVGGVSWFHLDKERNGPTWFSGMLFFLVGCAAIVAYVWERTRNAQGELHFRVPILWWGVAVAGWYMSLDEITILHENLYWRETRQLSAQWGAAWHYVTQWQVLFAPAIVLALGYFVLFFSNRFRASHSARHYAYTGLGCWVVALGLESVRGMFKAYGAGWYALQVLIEELLEMTGALFLLTAIVFYIVDIALDFTVERQSRLQFASRFLTKQATVVLSLMLLFVSAAGATVSLFAHRQALAEAPLPRLVAKALQSQPDGTPQESGTPQAVPEVWFDDLQAPLTLTDADGITLLRSMAASLLHQRSTEHAIPAAMRTETSPRIVFLSLSDGTAPAHVFMGAGKGLLQAVEQAIDHARSRPKPRARSIWLKLDIVQTVHAIPSSTLRMPADFTRSLQGIAFKKQLRLAFLPEELVAYTLVNSKRKLQRRNIARYLQRRTPVPQQSPDLRSPTNRPLYRFTTRSFFSTGTQEFRLYRGHRPFGRLTRDMLLAAARSGGEYLTQAVASDGKFAYSYRPKTDTVRDKYNILRHAGTTYAMLELYEITRDTSLLQAAERALKYLVRTAQPCAAGAEAARCIVEKGEVKLGGNALAIVALAQHRTVTGDQQYMPLMQQLGRWIQSLQEKNGRFRVHKQTYPEGRALAFVSQYYPGEALLAMVRLYALDSQERWLDTAAQGAHWLIHVRDKDVPVARLNHDHWLLYALNELHRLRPQPFYLQHASRIAHAIVQRQNRQPKYQDWLGSYYRPPRSTPTATRSEGLYAAYQLRRDFGDRQETAGILQAIQLGIAFQLQTQFRPESVLYIRNPQRALGGFRRSLTNYEIRIDYVQHNISSLLGLYRLLRDAS